MTTYTDEYRIALMTLAASLHTPGGGRSMADVAKELHDAIELALFPEKAVSTAPVEPPLTPAVPVKKSIHADHITCLECGKRFKSLKRHIAAHHDLSPEAYRGKWGLIPEYPMVAATYSATRSSLALQNGLGTKK